MLTTATTQKSHNVAILIPIYQSEKWLDRCIESATLQSVSHILIWDDGSTDRSLEIALNWQKNHPNIFIQSAPNLGACRARNALIAWALSLQVEWLQFIDADDWIRPGKVGKQLDQWDGSSLWLYCNQVYLDYNYDPPKIIFRRFVDPHGLGYPPHPGSWLIKTETFEKYPDLTFDDRFRACRNDLDFWLQAVTAHIPTQHTNFIGSFYRAEWSTIQLTNVPAWYELDTIQQKFPKWVVNQRSIYNDTPGNCPTTKSYLRAKYDTPKHKENNARICIKLDEYAGFDEDKQKILRILESFSSRNLPSHIVINWPWGNHEYFLSDLKIDNIEITNKPDKIDYTIKTGLEYLPIKPIELFDPPVNWEPFGINF